MNRNAGFSLIEVMVAVLILGVALVGLTQGITAALVSSKESELQTTAALIAAGQIEELRAGGFITEGTTEGEGGAGLALYRWKQTVSKTAIDGLYDLSVAVENRKSGKAIYDLRTMLFDPPSNPGAGADRRNSTSPRNRGRRP
jgi:prepilin-type N-terminal cleavage/methylation domain-containing protein